MLIRDRRENKNIAEKSSNKINDNLHIYFIPYCRGLGNELFTKHTFKFKRHHLF